MSMSPMNKKYTLSVTPRTALPRSKRLQKLGVASGVSGGSSTSVQLGGSVAGYDPDNRSSLDKLGVTPDNYIMVTQGGETTKARVGHADSASTAADAAKWSGKEFDDYLDQSVKTTADVSFSSVTADTIMGEGFSLTRTEQGSCLTVDRLEVSNKMVLPDVSIQSVEHIGGKQLLTAARCVAESVEFTGSGWKVYFRRRDGEGAEVRNTWMIGDQALMQTYNCAVSPSGSTGDRFYWRLVTAVGTDDTSHYIILSDTDAAEGSMAPIEGDKIVQLGYRYGGDRASAIVLSGAGEDSPSIAQYSGIVDFTLLPPDTQIKPGYSTFSGRVIIQPGSTGVGQFSDLPDEIQRAVQVGSENLLRNTSFTGDFASAYLSDSSPLGEHDNMYGAALSHWLASDTVSVVLHEASASGYACQMVTGDYIQQSVALLPGERYVLTFSCSGAVEIAGEVYKANGDKCRLDIVGTADAVIRFEAAEDTLLWEIKLERGTIPTDWRPSIHDTDKSADNYRDLWYLQEALSGKTEILGGLILSSLLQLGRFRDGDLESVTAGVNGVTSGSDLDIAFWGGGTLQQAIKTASMYRTNPAYQPTEEELASICKAVITHTGRAILNDIVLRGYVYAEGGVFRGDVIAKRMIVTRNEYKKGEGGLIGAGKLVDGAYITGPGTYILPALEEGQMVTVTWFNPPYSNSGTTTFKTVDDNTGVGIYTDDSYKFYSSVKIAAKQSIYNLIGDRPYNTEKTYWTIIDVGSYIKQDDDNTPGVLPIPSFPLFYPPVTDKT